MQQATIEPLIKLLTAKALGLENPTPLARAYKAIEEADFGTFRTWLVWRTMSVSGSKADLTKKHRYFRV